MDADGSHVRVLTRGSYDQQPRWSPDGRLIVYRRSPVPSARTAAADAGWCELGQYWTWKLTALPCIAIGVIGLILRATGH